MSNKRELLAREINEIEPVLADKRRELSLLRLAEKEEVEAEFRLANQVAAKENQCFQRHSVVDTHPYFFMIMDAGEEHPDMVVVFTISPFADSGPRIFPCLEPVVSDVIGDAEPISQDDFIGMYNEAIARWEETLPIPIHNYSPEADSISKLHGLEIANALTELGNDIRDGYSRNVERDDIGSDDGS